MKKTLMLILMGIAIFSCSNDDDKNQNNCDFNTLISSEQFKNSPSDELEIHNLEINNDCLKINFSSGGCSGDTWVVKLIDKGITTKSIPPQRSLKLSLKNDELCEALITKKLTFDISNLQVKGNQVKLNIANSNKIILYEY
ncbi:hypothetical protein [Aquimarina agarilytica]|uniref:hypothetical protein n=1 Tax=Aquimarina agarilytica TaxID=1087449 RepID=UPI000288858F|nr:hypothetical protein [Aquimarina agarilytica]